VPVLEPKPEISAPGPARPAAILLRATRAEAVGAGLSVGGLSVFERAVRQLGRAPELRVTIASDGSIPIGFALPANVQVVEAATAEPGDVTTIGADVVRRRATDFEGGIRVIDETTRREAEDAIFADLLRGDLGFVARHINKKISFRITRHILCRLPITPNQVTLAAAAVGFLGCLLIARGAYATTVAGFLLVQVQSVLDGCDGELARVRFQQSAIGEWLDTVVDDATNLAIMSSMGVGLWRAGLGWPAAAIASLACGMYLVYNVISYRELVRQRLGGDLLKIRWKLARGRDMKSMVGGDGGTGGVASAGGLARIRRALLALGRRDAIIFGWLVLAVLNLLPLALIWAFLMSLSVFVMAVGQVLPRADRESH
jgi:phosphatidylglycerophosphate synthase